MYIISSYGTNNNNQDFNQSISRQPSFNNSGQKLKNNEKSKLNTQHTNSINNPLKNTFIIDASRTSTTMGSEQNQRLGSMNNMRNTNFSMKDTSRTPDKLKYKDEEPMSGVSTNF